MDPERWQKIKSILDRSLDQAPDELDAWLARECEGDMDLRRQVEELLGYDERLDELTSVAGLVHPLDDELVGRRVGPYRIQEVLGRGGMGAVYRAERVEGFDQTVALKLMRNGITSRQALERFHRERQILARLEHPHIAHLLDGATSEDGRPYFAMELVDGEPIDSYCDTRRLSPRERVELMLPLCEALQFAHRNLVIHRDLKPGNILVSHEGVPKLLDFGIAKLLGPSDSASQTLGRAMTPRYASPEQLRDLPISISTDIYSLGVVLHQLLTGRLPCGLDTCGDSHVHMAVCHEDPKTPSELVVEVVPDLEEEGFEARSAEQVAQARGSDPKSLRKQLRGDLDAIVLKALRKEPEARYVSMDQLADDLSRYLNGLPVRARRGTMAYTLGKYVRRHRWGLAAGSLILVLILGFTLALSRQLERAEHERDRARRVSDFMVTLFRAAEPDRMAQEPSVRSLVDAGRERLRHELTEVPEVRADLLTTLAQVYEQLGAFDSASETLDQSLEALRQIHPGDHPDVAHGICVSAVLAYRWGDYVRSERQIRECIAMRRRLGLNEDLIKPRNNLAAVLRIRGQLDEAKRLYREGLKQRRERWGMGHPNVAGSLCNLAITHYLAGELDAAEPLLQEALGIRLAAHGEESAKVAEVYGHLARLNHGRGELDGAERLYLRALEIRRLRLGPDHLRVAALEKDLAALLVDKGEPVAAGPVLVHALGVLRRLKPAGDPILAEAQSVYGAYLAAVGRRAEADVCLRSSVETLERIRGTDVLPSRAARRRFEAWATGPASEPRDPV